MEGESRSTTLEPVQRDGEKLYRVLSLDGGGIQGIYTAEFPDRLTCYFARSRGLEALDLGKGFDLITGTSTGAIIACALAIGEPLNEVVELYREHGPNIFLHCIKDVASTLFRTLFLGGSVVRRGDTALRDALDDVLGVMTNAETFTAQFGRDVFETYPRLCGARGRPFSP